MTVPYPSIGGIHDIPIESIRLKYIRDSMEDFEYMELAKTLGKKSDVDAQVNSLFSNQDLGVAYWHWPKNNANAMLSVRENIAGLVAGPIIYPPPNVRALLPP